MGERLYEMLFGSDEEEEWRRNANLQVRVMVSYDGRSKKGQLGTELITDLAHRLNSGDESDYIIKLQNGSSLTDQQIKVRKEIDLPSFGKTILYRDAWEEMDVYWRELKQGGVIDW